MDQLNSLPYLERSDSKPTLGARADSDFIISVVREVLRVYAPVLSLERIAMQDDVLPLSRPYIDKAGNSHDTLMYAPR
jgi:hypothetical protein